MSWPGATNPLTGPFLPGEAPRWLSQRPHIMGLGRKGPCSGLWAQNLRFYRCGPPCGGKLGLFLAWNVLSACFRTLESLGNCLAYVVGSTSWPNVHHCILAFALWGTCLVPTTLAVGRVPPDKVEISEEENSHTKDVLHGDSSSEDSYRIWNEMDKEALFPMPDLDRKLTARDSVSGLPIRAPIAVHETSLWLEQAEA